MGTRSLTIMFDNPWSDKEPEEIAVLYRQFDGYPSGHGADLKDFLSGFIVVNGYNSTKGKIANGGSCLSAQLVANFKDGVGQFYLHSAGTRDIGEEYRYSVFPIKGENIKIEVESGYGENWKTIYAGSLQSFDPEMEE